MTARSKAIRLIALDEFTRRRAAWQQAAQKDGRFGREGEANLRLWLAIALAAGVGRDLPDAICRQIEVEAIWPAGRKYLPRAESIAPAAQWQAELARARDTARAKAEGSADQQLIQRALDLIHLADILGAPPAPSVASFERMAA